MSRDARLGPVSMPVRVSEPHGVGPPARGALTYADGQPQIPAAAVTTEDAARLQRMADRGTTVRLKLMMEARFLPDADSANVVGEIRGRELPNEVVVIGGHFDSWDVGTGSTDDGGGCVATWEALRIMKKLDLRPRRTVRVVLWTNEENGGRGGRAYRDAHLEELSKHVMMLEADSGLFVPVSFGYTGNQRGQDAVKLIASLLRGIGADRVTPGGGGSDIEPSIQAQKIASMSYDGTGDYFRIHHTEADTVDKIAPVDVSRAAAAIAVMSYVVADLPTRLGEERGYPPPGKQEILPSFVHRSLRAPPRFSCSSLRARLRRSRRGHLRRTIRSPKLGR